MVDFLPFSDETIFSVFSLADEYQVDILQRKCEDYLLSKCKDNNTSLTALVNILVCAEQYNLKNLFNASFDKVSKVHPDDVTSVPEYHKLHEETRTSFKQLREQALDVKLTGDYNSSMNYSPKSLKYHDKVIFSRSWFREEVGSV